MILCECEEFIEGEIFHDYIRTSINPSTPTIGHRKCGLIFNFVDGDRHEKYSSKKKLKVIAKKFAEKKRINDFMIGKFLLEVDRLKRNGSLSDYEIIKRAYKEIIKAQQK